MVESQKTFEGQDAVIKKRRKSLDSEFQSYTYIKNELRQRMEC